MDTLVYPVLFGLGFAGGFFSGLLGIGGGIIVVPLLLYVPPAVGLPMAIASLAGSVASNYVSNELMLTVFAAMALVAAVLMFLPLSESALGESLQQVEFNRSAAITIGVVIGGFAGIIGQGGAFLYIPA